MRKDTLVEYGFRLPSARDNRPLAFNEFEKGIKQAIFVSATPGVYEHDHSTAVIEQIIRPTGLVDPDVIVLPITPVLVGAHGNAPSPSQIDDVIHRIKQTVKNGDRALVTTLTKKMAEDLNDYLTEQKIKADWGQTRYSAFLWQSQRPRRAARQWRCMRISQTSSAAKPVLCPYL